MTAGRAPLSRGKGTPRTDSIGRRLTCSQVTGLVSGTKGTASAGRVAAVAAPLPPEGLLTAASAVRLRYKVDRRRQ
jgi:hypothetical protein